MTGDSDAGRAHAGRRSRPSKQLRLRAIRRTDPEVVSVRVGVSHPLKVDALWWRVLEFNHAATSLRECAATVTRPGASCRE